MQNLFSLLLFFSGSQADWGQSPASRSQRVKLEDLGLRGVAKCSPSLHWPKRLQLTLQGKDPVVIDVQSESQEMGTYFSCRKKRYRAVCSKTHWLPQFRLAKSLRSVAWCYLRSLVCGFSREEHTEATQSTGFLCPLKTTKKKRVETLQVIVGPLSPFGFLSPSGHSEQDRHRLWRVKSCLHPLLVSLGFRFFL